MSGEPSLSAVKVTRDPCDAVGCACYPQPEQRGAGRHYLIWHLWLKVSLVYVDCHDEGRLES